MSDFDLIVRNAVIHDGLGGEPVSGDLAVKDGKVAAIGAVEGSAANEIDAGGQVVAPGIVDVHTHYDAQLTWDPTASPSPALGVTTVVIGNCGFGIAPAPAEARNKILAFYQPDEGYAFASSPPSPPQLHISTSAVW